jgi:hypothetical protein
LSSAGEGSSPGLLGEPAPVGPARLQRVGGLTRRREHAHEQQHGGLAQWVGGHCRGGGPQHGIGPPGRQRRLDERIDHLPLQLGALLGGDRQLSDIAEIGQDRSPPQSVNPTQPLVRGVRITLGLPAGRTQLGPRVGEVELLLGECEAVAAGDGYQPLGAGCQLRAKPGDLRVQRLPPRLRYLGGPERVEQVLDGHRAPSGQREQRQQRASLGPANLDRSTVDDQAQRTQHVHADPAPPVQNVQNAHTGQPVSSTQVGVSPVSVRLASLGRASRATGPVAKECGMDHDKLTEFIGRITADMGATGSAGLAVIGNRLGLYRALAEGPATPERLAERTACHPRYLTEWLRNQAAGGYVSYQPTTGEFFMTEEQAFCLADPNGPNFSAVFLIGLGYLRAEPRITEAFRTGAGLGWHEHDEGRLRRLRRVLPARLRRRAGAELDPRPRRGAREADRRSPGGRRRLRARLLLGADRRGLPPRHGRRIGLPPGVHRARPQAGRRVGRG